MISKQKSIKQKLMLKCGVKENLVYCNYIKYNILIDCCSATHTAFTCLYTLQNYLNYSN